MSVSTLTVLAVWLLLGFVIWFVSTRERRSAQREVAARLRDELLSGRLLQGVMTQEGERVFSVAMDWSIGLGAGTTLASHSDGTVSMYHSGGVLGSQSARVLEAAAEFHEAAFKLESRFRPVTEYPFPPNRSFVFYVVRQHVTLASPVVPESITPDSPYFNVSRAAQALITAVRRSR